MHSKLGLCQWFHYQDDAAVEQTVDLLHDLGVRHLRTGISWADFHRPRGPQWYDRQMGALSDFDVLLSVWHTPPSISEADNCVSPPRRLEDFADFIEHVIDEYGDSFSHLELWNEPNNLYKWDFRGNDPGWAKFGEMIRLAAERASRLGKPTVLGGIIPVDPEWLKLMKGYGTLDDIDVIAIHGFPEMWWPDAPCWEQYGNWNGWDGKVDDVAGPADGRPVWITETGLATWDLYRHEEARFDLQCRMLERAVRAPAERVYWYSLIDLDARREAIEGFHVDENEYHLGLVKSDGRKKPAYHRFKELMHTEQGVGSLT